MARRIHYEVGDVFLVPLENDLKGVGRIISNKEATVLIELYLIKPVRDTSELNHEDAIKDKPKIIHWCYDDALIKGNWKIIGNKAINEKIEMPYFWFQDAGNMKYYIRKGSIVSFETVGDRIEISKEEKFKYEMSGIGNEVSEKNKYMKRLSEADLI